MLFKLVPYHSQRKGGSENGSVDIPKQVRQRTDVVFMGMGQNDSQNFGFVLPDIIHVRNNKINTQHVVFGKHQARVNNDKAVDILNDHHIEANFSQPAQRDNF